MRATINQDLSTIGLVVFAHLPFTDTPDRYKTRPVVVVVGTSEDRNIIRVSPITSSDVGRAVGVPLVDWEQVGLTRPSSVYPRTVDVDRRFGFSTIIGELSHRDLERVHHTH